jgi:hypothetical protein
MGHCPFVAGCGANAGDRRKKALGTLSDPVHEFDAGDRRCSSPKTLEAEHRTEPQLGRSVILFDQIIQIF